MDGGSMYSFLPSRWPAPIHDFYYTTTTTAVYYTLQKPAEEMFELQLAEERPSETETGVMMEVTVSVSDLERT